MSVLPADDHLEGARSRIERRAEDAVFLVVGPLGSLTASRGGSGCSSGARRSR